MNKTKVYAREDEKFVKCTVLYASASKVLFYDKEAKTDKVLKDDLEDLFLKGVVIRNGADYFKPVALKSTGIIVYDGSAAVTYTGSNVA